MLFRDINGKLVNINKIDYIHDFDYFNKIACINGCILNSNMKEKNFILKTIINLVK